MSNTITRLGFEKALRDARDQTMRAVGAQAALFHEMCDSIPRLDVLKGHALRMSDATAQAERAFSIAFAINPQSKRCMHMFASFNAMVRAADCCASLCALGATTCPPAYLPVCI